MKVVVFGASQGVGRFVAAGALRRGHGVTAFGVPPARRAGRPGGAGGRWHGRRAGSTIAWR